MTRAGLPDLVRAFQAKSLAERAAVQPLLDAEAVLRRELERLSDHEKAARSDLTALVRLGAHGGDVIWEAWLDRQRKKLNSQLARVLAEKVEAMHALRQSEGQRAAAEKLLEMERMAARKAGQAGQDRERQEIAAQRFYSARL